MKILVVGCGKVGSEIARDLAGSREVDALIAMDASSHNLKLLRKSVPRKLRTVKLSISQKPRFHALLGKVDLVCGALPGRLGFDLMSETVKAGRDTVDISYTPRDAFLLQRKAKEGGSRVVPQCGVAPGFTNMCVGDASRQLDKMMSVEVFVGGLPEKPQPPLNYRIVFSLEDVVNEYSRPVQVIEEGKRKKVEALSGGGLTSFPGVGKLEYFLTDGLGSLPRSYPRTREMHEFTLRYPGHADMMQTLRVLGFFERKPVRVGGVVVEPRQLSIELLRGAMSKGSPEDFLALRVDVKGMSSGKRIRLRYQLLDHYDRKSGVSAMARTTAYPCTSVALLMGRGEIKETGIVTPEKIAQDPRLFRYVLARLAERGVRMKMAMLS
ncbi:saccharopine dehydrogenase [Candidatus Bathyarchaeota archaeon]|nr:MAG: saccharopine dehydrogenase [Candidatus Bathyarchaeota archaeon]TMI57573.1 MAG: saccharopine dehydrogenase [Candidatus Bathyarchaeota archaeon]